MPATLILREETASGDLVGTHTLDFAVETVTVRELITRRVREEVREHARRGGGADWERQRDAALAAFAANGFFVLVGDRQVRDLDETIRLELRTEVTFVRLVPLVGG